MRFRTLLATAATFTVTTAAFAQQPETTSTIPDYAQSENWLCLPGQDDACAVSIDTTLVEADGTMTVEENAIVENPTFDCFYVYPTVSNDESGNSDLIANDEERRVILLQAAPFRQACRMYAPLYRQVTLTALRRGMTTGDWSGVDREMAANDVKAAWDYYMTNHNEGRGVVLIGHSQGSGILARLLGEQGGVTPLTTNMISALLIGTNVGVPESEDAGGQLGDTPLCRAADQTGCVVSFVSFRSDVPPPATSRFGKVEGEGQVAACVNPAAPAGGSAPLDAWLANRSLLEDSTPFDWVEGGETVTTGFVRVPGLLSAQCVAENGANYLAVTVNADPADPRTDTIAGDVMVSGQRLDDWGLHLIDMNLAMGDMIAMIERQAAAWMAAHPQE